MESTIKLSDSHDLSKFDTLVCIDGSYVIYHTLYSAVKKWTDESPYSDLLTSIDVKCDDFEQLDITQYADFADIAKGRLIEVFTKINSMVKDYNNAVFSNTHGRMFFVLDPEHGIGSRSWRFILYPEYKGQRSAAKKKKPFNVNNAFEKMIEILKEDDMFSKRFNISIFSADNAEADDIIATIFMDEENKNFHKYLIASDHDYLQLQDVTQMTLEGKQVEIEQPYPQLINVTPEKYLLAKIIVGDDSDNITQVFDRVGYKTAIKKFVANPQFLVESLECDAVANEKFKRNTKLIDFSRIPKKIRAIAKKAIAHAQ